MPDHTQHVAEVKADLIARGIIKDPQTTACEAFAICRETAYRLVHEFGEHVMLVAIKEPANGCDYKDGRRYRLDAIAYPGGQWIDCLGSGGPPANANIPRWGNTGTDPGAELVEPWTELQAPPTEPPHPLPGNALVLAYVAQGESLLEAGRQSLLIADILSRSRS